MTGYLKRRVNADEKIRELLIQMEQLYEGGQSGLKPEYQCYVIYLDSLVKSQKPGSAEKAEKLLSRLERLYLNLEDSENKLNNYAYNSVMFAWANSVNRREGFIRVSKIIQRMKTLHEETGNEELKPDKVSYSTLMMAIMRYHKSGVGEKCFEILTEMEKEYSNGNKSLQPDIITYANVIKALSLSKEAKKAEDLLGKVENLAADGTCDYPTVACYNHVMSAYVRGRSNPVRKADEILERIRLAKVNGNKKISPDINTVSTYLGAIESDNFANATLQNVTTAKALLKEVYEREGNRKFKPNAKLWMSLINASIVVSPKFMKAEEAASTFKSMKDSGVSLNRKDAIHACNLVLKGCKWTRSDTKGSDQALDIAWDILHMLQTNVKLQPDSTSYYYSLWVCHQHISDKREREEEIKSLIENCCKNGFLSKHILESMLVIASDEMFQTIFGRGKDSSLALDSFHPEWSCHKTKHRSRW
jgi:hypothetical protein